MILWSSEGGGMGVFIKKHRSPSKRGKKRRNFLYIGNEIKSSVLLKFSEIFWFIFWMRKQEAKEKLSSFIKRNQRKRRQDKISTPRIINLAFLDHEQGLDVHKTFRTLEIEDLNNIFNQNRAISKPLRFQGFFPHFLYSHTSLLYHPSPGT
jgi:hypothetical protein